MPKRGNTLYNKNKKSRNAHDKFGIYRKYERKEWFDFVLFSSLAMMKINPADVLNEWDNKIRKLENK